MIKTKFTKNILEKILNIFMCDSKDFEMALLEYIIIGFKDAKQLNNINKEDKIIVTTEKDTMRFKTLETLDDNIKSILYYIPVEVKFIKKSEKESFNKKIHNHVRKYQANKQLSKK